MLTYKTKPKTFINYAATKGLVLLPDDRAWLRNQLKNVPKQKIKPILVEFVEIWVNTMAQCDNAVKRQNEGRRAANTWLRERICKAS